MKRMLYTFALLIASTHQFLAVAEYCHQLPSGANEEICPPVPNGNLVTPTIVGGCMNKFKPKSSKPLPIDVSASIIPDTCGLGMGVIDLTVSGGVPPYSFSWSNGAGTEDVSNLVSGSYTVTITDAGGDTFIETYFVETYNPMTVFNFPLFFEYSGYVDNTSCDPNNPNGGIDITPTTNLPFAWIYPNGVTTPSIHNLSAGAYSATVTLGNCVEYHSNLTIADIPDSPDLTAVVDNSSCGQPNGAINLSVSGAEPPYTFLWSNGATTEDVSGLPTGLYSVVVTSSDGCTANGLWFVFDGPSFDVAGTVTDVNSCASPNGAIDLEPNPAGSYAYQWSGGQTEEDPGNLSPGDYLVTVTDTDGCTVTASFTVDDVAEPPNLGALSSPAYCGLSNGAVSTTVSGGMQPYQFQWSNGGATADIDGLPPGSYTVTVTGANGCTATATATVADNILNITVAGEITANTFCGTGNGSVDITPSPSSPLGGNYVFDWSNPDGTFSSSTEDISMLSPGTYSVTVGLGTGCTAIGSFTVTDQTDTPTATTAVAPATCGQDNGGVNLTPSGGSPPYAYSWSNTATTEDISNIPAGAYSVTVTGSDGCTATASATVPESGGGTDTTAISGTSCNPAEVGTFTQNLTGQSGCDSVVVTTVTHLPGDTVQVSGTSCNPSDVGTTQQLFTNQNGCDSLVVTTIAFSASDTTAIFGTSCNPADVGTTQQLYTNSNGCDSLVFTTISFSASDTTAIFGTSCNPSDVGTTQQLFTNSNGCDSLVITTIGYSASDTTAIFGTSCNPADVGTTQQLFTNSNGCDSLVVTTIAYSASDTTDIFGTSCNPADVGTSQQLLTNANGCDSLVVTTIAYSASDTTAVFGTSCNPSDVGTTQQLFTNSNGCDSLVVTTIAFSASDTTAVFGTSCNPADVGTTQQLFTNTNGCDSLVVTTITFSASDTTAIFGTSCNPADVGMTQQLFTNSNGCDSLVVTTIAYSASDTTAIFGTSCNPADVGTTQQLYTNTNGCDSLVVTTIVYSASDTTAIFGTSCNLADVGMTQQLFTNSNGCDSLVVTTISLVPSNTTSLAATTCNPTQTGIFVQNLVTWQGCDSTVTTTVTLLPSATTNLTATTCDPTQVGIFVQNLVTWQGCDSTVTTTVTLLPSATTLLTATTCDPSQAGTFTQNLVTWQGCDSTVTTTVTLLPSATTSLASTTCDPTQAGSFVQNLNTWQGCDSTVTTTVSWSPPPILSLTASDFNGFGVSCVGAADGWAQAFAIGVSPFSYSWQNGTASSLLEGLAPGQYAVTATDGNGCTASASVGLAGPGPLMLGLSVTGLDCFDNNSGAVFATATGAALPYTYRLRPVGTTSGSFQQSGTFGGLGAGAYEISVLDANGCSASELVAVNAPVPLSVELGEDILIELGDGTALEALASVTWDSLAQVDWSGVGDVECPACPGQQVYPLVTTGYSITVVDGQGCLASDGLTVYVDRTKSVYVPSGFSPNGDGINDLLTIYARPGQVERIRSFQVFDRWGESVYRYFDFQPDDPAAGWDGSHRGELMDASVFVWFAEVEFTDGTSQVLKGDVVLVR